MAKPIFIVKIPVRINDEQQRAQLEHVGRDLQTKLKDYHVLTIAENRNDDKGIQFECFNVGEVAETTIQEIQEKIFKIIETNELSDWDVTLMDGLEDE